MAQEEQNINKEQEYLNGWKRERADFLNYKKEEAERISSLAKYANEALILDFLPVLDNLRLAQSHINDDGITQIIKQFEDILAKEGIEPIPTIGLEFDPNLMESVGAASQSEASLAPSGRETVAEEVQRGYTMNGKLIRVAKVKISK